MSAPIELSRPRRTRLLLPPGERRETLRAAALVVDFRDWPRGGEIPCKELIARVRTAGGIAPGEILVVLAGAGPEGAAAAAPVLDFCCARWLASADVLAVAIDGPALERDDAEARGAAALAEAGIIAIVGLDGAAALSPGARPILSIEPRTARVWAE